MFRQCPFPPGRWLAVAVLVPALVSGGAVAQQELSEPVFEPPPSSATSSFSETSDSLVPIEIGPRDEVGKESLGRKATRKVVGGVIGGLLGGRSRGSSAPSGPKTRRDPTRRLDYVNIESSEAGITAGARTRWTDDGLLVSSKIHDHDEKGTFHSVYLESCDGRRLYPQQLEIYDLWAEHTLTVSWTRTTYVDGQVVSRESGGWSESWSEKLGRFGRDAETPAGIWQLYGYSRAHAGIQQMGAYFNLDPGELAELGQLALVEHFSRPEQDPVTTEPFFWLISGGDDEGPVIEPPATDSHAPQEHWQQWQEECPVPRMVSAPEPVESSTQTRTRPRPEDEEIPPTVPEEWPPEVQPQACSVTSLESLPEPPIKVQLGNSDSMDDFPWPRPVPLQIRARDYDLLVGRCSGCEGGTSEQHKPLEDAIGSIRWQLDGEGSLNDPYTDTFDLDAIQAEIDALRKRIREISGEIAELELQKENLDASREQRRQALQAELAALESTLDEGESRHRQLTAEVDEGTAEVSRLETEITDRRARIDDRRDRIDAHRARIEELNERIAGQPSAETQALAAELETLEAEREAARTRLTAARQDQKQSEQDLRAAMDAAETALDRAIGQRDGLANRAQALQDRIRALESELFNAPLMRQILGARHRIDQLARELNALAPQAMETPSVFRAVRRLASAGPADRAEAIEQIRLRANEAVAQARTSCIQPECGPLIDQLATEVDTLDRLLAEAADAPNRLIDPEVMAQLQTARERLATINPQLEAAESAVGQARLAADQARQALLDGLRQFEQELQPLRADIERIEGRIADVAGRLSDQQLADALETERNRPGWEAEIATLRTEIDTTRAEIDRLRTELAGLSQELIEAESRLQDLQIDRAALEEELAFRRVLADEKRAALDALENETDRLEEQIEQLEQQRDQLEDELANLMARASSEQDGTKQAEGRQAWFVPPPLERLLKDPQEFDRLKREIGKKEADLAEALGAKQGLQKEAFAIIRAAVAVLWKWRAANEQIEQLTEEIDQLESERAGQQADNVAAGQDRLRRAQARKGEIEAQQGPAQSELDGARRREDQRQGFVDDADAAVESARQALDQAREALAEAQGQLRFQQRNREAKQAVVNRQRGEHERLVGRIRAQETELAAIDRSIAREIDAGNESGAANLRQAADAARRELRALEAQLQQSRDTLTASEADLRAAVSAEEQAAVQFDDATEARFASERELRNARARLGSITTALDAARLERERAERRLAEIENRLEQAEQEIEQANREIATSDQTRDLDRKIEAKKKEKQQAENDRNAAEDKFGLLSERREQFWESDEQADADIDDARSALKTANRQLREFLEQEIAQIDLTVVIRLEVSDNPVDQWRAGDEMAQRHIRIRYRGRDIVELEMPDADPDLNPPADTTIPAYCQVDIGFEADAEIQQVVAPDRRAREPLTIALWYRKGEHLYDTWPPIRVRPDPRSASTTSTASSPDTQPMIRPPDDGLPLMRAADWWRAAGGDGDRMIALCQPGGGGGNAVGMAAISEGVAVEDGPAACVAGPSRVESAVDMVHSNWSGAASMTSANEDDWYLKVPDVPPDRCIADSDIRVQWRDRPGEFSDGSLEADDSPLDESKRMQYRPGLIGDYTPRGVEFDRDDRVELRIQLFDGEHKGLAGEQLHWRVVFVAPELEEEKYGFSQSREKELPDERTDESGYSRVDFYLETAYGEATVEVVWKRGDNDCKTVTIPVERNLGLQALEMGLAPTEGWPQGEQFFRDGGEIGSLVEGLPEETDTAVVFGVGVLDDQLDPHDDAEIAFQPLAPPGYDKLDPETMVTRTYGLAWTHALDLPDDAEVEIEAEIDEPRRPYTDPPKVIERQSTARVHRFRIGPEGARLTIETDEGFVPGGAAWSGTGRLIVEGLNHIPQSFSQLDLKIDGLEVDAEGGEDAPIAIAGTARWPAGDGDAFAFDRSNFRFELKKLGLSAGSDGLIEGSVAIDTGGGESSQADFSATMGPKGFYGTLSDMPEIRLAGMRLEKGAHVELDLHGGRDPDPAIGNWGDLTNHTRQGLLIRQGRILLPESLKGSNDTPPALSVKNLVLAASGVSGEVTLTHTISAGMGNLTFSITEVMLKLEKNQPTGTVIRGALKLPEPWVGEVNGELAVDAGNQYRFVVGTETPVSAPSLGMVFHIRQLMGEYAEEKFTFEIKDALLRSETFSDFDVRRFGFDSNGNLDASLEFDDLGLKFAAGFDIQLKALEFTNQDSDVRVAVTSGFKFAAITADQVHFAITNGPTIEELDIDVEYDRPPVKITGGIVYQESLFEGNIDLDAKALSLEAMLVMGAQREPPAESWTFWYVELNSRTSIPLGQSGISITQLGGGVGYNYDPPIGSTPGAPRRTDALSLKATLGLGDTPTAGRVMAGRTQMVLVSGRFSINGKFWVLDREDSMYGEGQLNYYWEPVERVDGFVRMGLGIPDQAGTIVSLNGEIGFHFNSADDWEIRSKRLDGALLERIEARGIVLVQPELAQLEGSLAYSLYIEHGVDAITLKAEVDLSAEGALEIRVTEQSSALDAQARFNGRMDIALDTWAGEYQLAAAQIAALLHLRAQQTQAGFSGSIDGSVDASWQVWIFEGSHTLDIGYRI